MPLATGVVTKTVTFGPFKDYLGNPAQGGRVSFRASTDLYWAATGEVLLADTKVIEVDFDAEGWIVLPAVDQAGFTTQDGSAITLWTYQASRTLIMASGEIRVLPEKSFQIYESDPATIDLESVVGVESSGGVIVPAPVTSVAGLVGSITGVSLMLALGAAPLASPALTGTPTAPTASGGTSTTQIATTAFVAAAITGGGATPDATYNLKGKAYLGVVAVRAVSANATVALSDIGNTIVGSSATPFSVTFVANSSVACPVGSEVEVINVGVGALAVVDNTSGTPATFLTLAQYEAVTLRQTAINVWVQTNGGGSGGAGAGAGVTSINGETGAVTGYLKTPAYRAVTASTTLIAGDANGSVAVNSASATNVTIPPNSSVPFANGTTVKVGNIGAGVVTLLDNTTGTPVTVTTLNQGDALSYTKFDTNSWSVT